VNVMAHSMGGLDCRDLISKVRPEEDTPLSVTTILTPHHGSPFMDWCAVRASPPNFTHLLMPPQENIGLGRVTAAVKKSTEAVAVAAEHASTPHDAAAAASCSIVDSPAYGNLATGFLSGQFNADTPDDSRVRYFSVAPARRARTSGTRSGSPSSYSTAPSSARARPRPPPPATRARAWTRSGGTTGT
jgi:triacylglycerol lipase